MTGVQTCALPIFSTLWIFVSLNYLYCDVSSLMDPELLPQYLRGNVHSLEFSPMFLLSAGILVEIFTAMVLLSRLLPYRANRWANIAAGVVMTTIQLATLFVGLPAPYYAFFSAIEIATTAFIVWHAWNWTECHEAGGLPPEARLLLTNSVSEGGRLSWCTSGWT